MAALSLDGIPPAYCPRLKLFLSADIIGSTAYKQPLDLINDEPASHLRWSEIIQAFYKTIYDGVKEHWRDASTILEETYKKDPQELIGPMPKFWKTIGDEVVFWKEMTSGLQIWITLACWMKTIESMRDTFDGFGDDASLLDVKSTAWIAGFPVRNKAVLAMLDTASTPEPSIVQKLEEFYKDGTSAPLVDFIGPGIDVGFRISSFSSSRKMSVSLDVAYLLAQSHNKFAELKISPSRFFPASTGAGNTAFVERLRVHYGGSESLKGVLGGIRYPKFWISTLRHGSLEEARVNLYNPGDTVCIGWDELLNFCNQFYQDRKKYVSKPFIRGDPSFNDIPDEYAAFLRAAVPQPSIAAEDFSSL